MAKRIFIVKVEKKRFYDIIILINNFQKLFLRFRFLSDNTELKNRKKIWWLADRLSEENGHYVLEIDMQDFDSFPQEFTFKIKFDRAEVDRI